MRTIIYILLSSWVHASMLAAEQPELVGDRQLIEMTKLEAAQGVLAGAIKRYEHNLDTSKSIFVIHSHSNSISGWIIWIIWTKSDMLAVIFSQNLKAPEWVAVSAKSSHGIATSMIEKVNEIINILHSHDKLSWDMTEKNTTWQLTYQIKSDKMHRLQIDFPADDSNKPRKELKRKADELIQLTIKAAKELKAITNP